MKFNSNNKTMVKIEKTISATVQMTNAEDEVKAYHIEGNVSVNESGNVSSISNGLVKNGEQHLATFSCYGSNLKGNASISYMGIEADTQSIVLAEVHKFIDACIERVAQGVDVK